MLRNRMNSLRKDNPELFARPDYEKQTYETEGICLVTNPTGIYAKEPEVFYQLTQLMKAAGKETEIHTPYLVCNTYMEKTPKRSEGSRTGYENSPQFGRKWRQFLCIQRLFAQKKRPDGSGNPSLRI